MIFFSLVTGRRWNWSCQKFMDVFLFLTYRKSTEHKFFAKLMKAIDYYEEKVEFVRRKEKNWLREDVLEFTFRTNLNARQSLQRVFLIS